MTQTSAMFAERGLRTWLCLLGCCCALMLSACGGGGGGSSSTPAQDSPPPQPGPSGNAAPVDNPPQQIIPAGTEIKLLALFTPGVTEQFVEPDLRIEHLVNVANDTLLFSGVELTFAVEHMELVDYPDDLPITQALDDLTFATHSALAHIPALRNETEADLVVLIRPYANDGQCGYAWIGGYQTEGDFTGPAEADYGYSVVSGNCSDYTLLHELGHNLGLAHSRRESPVGGTFGYALGYGMDNDFVTIMASPSEFGATQLPKLSSPNLDCNGNPCGVAHDSAGGGADAVRAVNISKDQVAAYR